MANNNPKILTETVSKFYGLDRRERIQPGYFSAMSNCSSRKFPTLAPRYLRGTIGSVSGVQGMIAKDALCFVANNQFYINYYPVAGLTLTAGEKQLVGMGAYVIILPDKVYVNTENQSDYGYIENSYSGSGMTYSLCDLNGEAIDAEASDTPPEDPEDGDYWIDTSGETDVLKRWSETNKAWTEVPTAYTKIAKTGINTGFAKWDGVTFSGSSVDSINGTKVIYGIGEGYIIIPNVLRSGSTESGTLSITRAMPDMDFVVECDNRLWGCKYGFVGGKTVNEIYACALGDFKNWNRYLGISTDSYTASRGCDGVWTGAINYLGNPLFFKANTIETVYPSSNGAHQIETVNINGTGVKVGCGASLKVVDGALYYEGISGFYRYTGSLPVNISAQFGETYYKDGVAGDLAGFYYVSVLDEDDNPHLFVYDTTYGTWYEEDDTRVNYFARVDAELYAFSDHLFTVRGTTGTLEEDMEWFAETHDFGYSTNDAYVRSVLVRAKVPEYSYIRIEIMYDDSGMWETVGEFGGEDTHNHYGYPIIPHRCDHFKLKLSGDGDSAVWDIVTEYTRGDDQ